MNTKSAPTKSLKKPQKAHKAVVKPLSPHIQQHIGNLLKATYGEVLAEPVPDRFKNILAQLEKAEKDSGNGK